MKLYLLESWNSAPHVEGVRFIAVVKADNELDAAREVLTAYSIPIGVSFNAWEIPQDFLDAEETILPLEEVT